ncbi:site-specific integrase [Streptomyces sp. NPDC019937]|uniref:tyrosine-type recombinase/integrase n=1 Tax=Streptomyces sp. NPDC019937 TaxID=3154787 RepID=UPI0033E219D9
MAAAAGWIEDRWLKKRKDPVTGKRERTKLWGTKTARYKVCGIPGVRARSFDVLDDAKAWKSKAQAAVMAGEFFDPRSGNITLREYVEETWWPALRAAPRTKAGMEWRIFNHILPYMGDHRLNAIGTDEIKWWTVQAEQRIDAGTVRVAWSHFSKIMQSAKTAKKIVENPFRDPDLKAPTRPKSKAKAWPRETVAGVQAALPEQYKILVDEAALAGLRQGEAFGLSPDDLDGDEIHVVRQVTKVRGKLAFAPPKNNKERRAPCPPELAEAVKAHMDQFPPVDVTLPWLDPDRPTMAWEDRPLVTVRLLVTTPGHGKRPGGAVNPQTFDDRQWKPALVAAGVLPPPEEEIIRRPGKKTLRRVRWAMPREDGFHVLRHTFASVVLHGGETIIQLAAWLGHSDPAFTLRTYVHFMPRSGKAGIAALGRWLRGDDEGSEAA